MWSATVMAIGPIHFRRSSNTEVTIGEAAVQLWHSRYQQGRCLSLQECFPLFLPESLCDQPVSMMLPVLAVTLIPKTCFPTDLLTTSTESAPRARIRRHVLLRSSSGKEGLSLFSGSYLPYIPSEIPFNTSLFGPIYQILAEKNS